LACLDLPCLVLSCPALSYRCLVWSCFVLFCLVLSCLAFPCLVSSFVFPLSCRALEHTYLADKTGKEQKKRQKKESFLLSFLFVFPFCLSFLSFLLSFLFVFVFPFCLSFFVFVFPSCLSFFVFVFPYCLCHTWQIGQGCFESPRWPALDSKRVHSSFVRRFGAVGGASISISPMRWASVGGLGLGLSSGWAVGSNSTISSPSAPTTKCIGSKLRSVSAALCCSDRKEREPVVFTVVVPVPPPLGRRRRCLHTWQHVAVQQQHQKRSYSGVLLLVHVTNCGCTTYTICTRRELQHKRSKTRHI
jgi:hypothetical protein